MFRTASALRSTRLLLGKTIAVSAFTVSQRPLSYTGTGVAFVLASGVLLSTKVAQSEPALEDCPDVACSSKKDALFASFGNAKASGKPNKKNKEEDENAVDYDECPLDREELGRATWKVLHSFAAYYPINPSETDKLAAKGLVDAVVNLYPCTHCREHFAKGVAENPPDLSSRDAFSKWVCNRHNVVNKWLGKPEVACGATFLETRWRTGSSKCRGESLSASETLGREDD